MESFFFYSFAGLSVIGAIALILFRNPVSSAMSMVASFVGLAALFIGLNAYFVGIIQILVYAGAIMVLFLFIIMLLDLKATARPQRRNPLLLVSGTVIPLIFLGQICTVLPSIENKKAEPLALEEAADPAVAKEQPGGGEVGAVSLALDVALHARLDHVERMRERRACQSAHDRPRERRAHAAAVAAALLREVVRGEPALRDGRGAEHAADVERVAQHRVSQPAHQPAAE